MAKNRAEHAESVAQLIIEQLEKGTAKFQRPWKDSLQSNAPRNGITKTKYRGINALYLEAVQRKRGLNDPRWYTFNNIQKLPAGEGGKRPLLKKGSKGVTVEKWHFDKEEKGPDGKTIKVKLDRPYVQFFTVFNGEDIIGLKPYVAPDVKGPEWVDVSRAEALFEDVVAHYREQRDDLSSEHAFIRHGGDEAYYSPHLDYIQMPAKEQFASAVQYYTVAFHELGHSTGHKARLNRDLTGGFGSESYAKEELRAEIASMILGEELGIGHDGERHASYVASWIKVLKNDPQEIFRAARDADLIARYVMKLEKNKPLEVEVAQESVAGVAETPVREPVVEQVPVAAMAVPNEPENAELSFKITGLNQTFDALTPAIQAYIEDSNAILHSHDIVATDGKVEHVLTGHDWQNDGSFHVLDMATPELKAYYDELVRGTNPKRIEENLWATQRAQSDLTFQEMDAVIGIRFKERLQEASKLSGLRGAEAKEALETLSKAYPDIKDQDALQDLTKAYPNISDVGLWTLIGYDLRTGTGTLSPSTKRSPTVNAIGLQTLQESKLFPRGSKLPALEVAAMASTRTYFEQASQRAERQAVQKQQRSSGQPMAVVSMAVPVEDSTLKQAPTRGEGVWKFVGDLEPNDMVIERNQNGKAVASLVDDIRHMRDAMVTVDFDGGARTSIYPSERKVRVATDLELLTILNQGIEEAFPREVQLEHLPEVEKLQMLWVRSVLEKYNNPKAVERGQKIPDRTFELMGITTKGDGPYFKYSYGTTHLGYLDGNRVSKKTLMSVIDGNIYGGTEQKDDFIVWASERADQSVANATKAEHDAFHQADVKFQAELDRVYGENAGDARYYPSHEDAGVSAAKQGFIDASNAWHQAMHDARLGILTSIMPADFEGQVERHASAMNWMATRSITANEGYDPAESFKIMQDLALKEGLRPVAHTMPEGTHASFEVVKVEYYKLDGEKLPIHSVIAPDGKSLSFVGPERVPLSRYSSDEETIAKDLRYAIAEAREYANRPKHASIETQARLQEDESFANRMSALPADWSGEIALEPCIVENGAVRATKAGEMPNRFAVYAFDGNQVRQWLSDVDTVAEGERFVSYLKEYKPEHEPRLVDWSEVQQRDQAREQKSTLHVFARRDYELSYYPVAEELVRKFEAKSYSYPETQALVAEYGIPMLMEHMQVVRGTHDSVLAQPLGETNGAFQLRLLAERQPQLAQALAMNWESQKETVALNHLHFTQAVYKEPGLVDSPWTPDSLASRIHEEAQALFWEADNENRRRNLPINAVEQSMDWSFRANHLKTRTHSWESGSHGMSKDEKAQLLKDIDDCRVCLDASQVHFKNGDWDRALDELGRASGYESFINEGKPSASKQFFIADLAVEVGDKWRKWQQQQEVGVIVTPRMQRDFNSIPKNLGELAGPGFTQKIGEQVELAQTRARARSARKGRSV